LAHAPRVIGFHHVSRRRPRRRGICPGPPCLGRHHAAPWSRSLRKTRPGFGTHLATNDGILGHGASRPFTAGTAGLINSTTRGVEAPAAAHRVQGRSTSGIWNFAEQILGVGRFGKIREPQREPGCARRWPSNGGVDPEELRFQRAKPLRGSMQLRPGRGPWQLRQGDAVLPTRQGLPAHDHETFHSSGRGVRNRPQRSSRSRSRAGGRRLRIRPAVRTSTSQGPQHADDSSAPITNIHRQIPAVERAGGWRWPRQKNGGLFRWCGMGPTAPGPLWTLKITTGLRLLRRLAAQSAAAPHGHGPAVCRRRQKTITAVWGCGIGKHKNDNDIRTFAEGSATHPAGAVTWLSGRTAPDVPQAIRADRGKKESAPCGTWRRSVGPTGLMAAGGSAGAPSTDQAPQRSLTPPVLLRIRDASSRRAFRHGQDPPTSSGEAQVFSVAIKGTTMFEGGGGGGGLRITPAVLDARRGGTRFCEVDWEGS